MGVNALEELGLSTSFFMYAPVEQVYEKHKDLFVELEKHFTLHLVNYTDSESIPSHEYKMAFIASGAWKML